MPSRPGADGGGDTDSDGGLPVTGAGLARLGALGVLLTGAGGLTLAASRRRRSTAG